MIRNLGDHSANERTFLAWVRTAIAVMAFGFLVEKFDLFLELAAPALSGRTLSLPSQKFGNIAGLALIIVGTVMVAIAALRFLVTAKKIDSEEKHSGTGSRIDVALRTLSSRRVDLLRARAEISRGKSIILFLECRHRKLIQHS